MNKQELYVLYYDAENNIAICNDGKLYSIEDGDLQQRHEKINCNGYSVYHVLKNISPDGSVLVHRYIGIKLVDVPEKLRNIDIKDLQINHKDGNKLNNKPENLEWCTCQENVRHAILNNLDHRQNIRDERIDEIIKDRKENRLSIHTLGEKYDMSSNSTKRILQEAGEYEPLNNSNNPMVEKVRYMKRYENLSVEEISSITGLKKPIIYYYLNQDTTYDYFADAKNKKTESSILDKAVELYKQGMSANKIGIELGISKATVLKNLRTFDWYNPEEKKKMQKDNCAKKFNLELIVQLREQKKTWNEIAEICCCENVNTLKSWYNRYKKI